MAALNRPTQATYEIHEHMTVDTSDNEDHTFCGVMFPIKCKNLLPLDKLVIKSVAVRGYLGPLTVWVSKDTLEGDGDAVARARSNNYKFKLRPKYWDKIYEKTHSPSIHDYCTLHLDTPIIMTPGQVRAIYIHSTLPGDQAIVYDNTRYGMKRYEDDKLTICTGRAHVSTQVFGQHPIWGWGNAWRDQREFVGKLEYGTVYKLWNPHMNLKFGGKFQDGARSLFMCQRRWESPFSRLPDECIFYILNMCRWDWFDDDSANMKQRRKKEMGRIKAAEKLAKEEASAAAAAASSSTVPTETSMDTSQEADTESAKSTARRQGCCSKGQDSDDDEIIVENRPADAASEDEDENSDDNEDDDDDEGEMEWSDVEDRDDDDDDDDDDEEDEEDYEYEDERGNPNTFSFQDRDSDDSDNESDNDSDNGRAPSHRSWFRTHVARLHLLRALGAVEDENVRVVGFDVDG